MIAGLDQPDASAESIGDLHPDQKIQEVRPASAYQVSIRLRKPLKPAGAMIITYRVGKN
jgi:hypothetical protein